MKNLKARGKLRRIEHRDSGFAVALTLAIMSVVAVSLAFGLAAAMLQGAPADARVATQQQSRSSAAVATWRQAGLPTQVRAAVASDNSSEAGQAGDSPSTSPERAEGDGQSQDGASSSSAAPSATDEASPSSASPTSEAVAATLEKTIDIADGKHYTVRVEYGADAGIPAGAELSVAQVIETPEGYDPQKPEFKGRPTETEQFVSAEALKARQAELAKAVDVREGDEAFYAFFLSIALKVDGQEVQPAADAKVKVTVETDAVAVDQADHLRASFFTDKKPGAEHADALKLADQSHDPLRDKKYEKGAKVAFEADKLTELGLMGVTTAEELEAARAEAEAGHAAGPDGAGSEAAGADGAKSASSEQAEPATEQAAEPDLSAFLVAASSSSLAYAVEQERLAMVAAADGDLATSFIVSWVDDDGTVLQTSTVAEGNLPVFDGSEPAKAQTDQYAYEFAGWTSSADGELHQTGAFPVVTKGTTYTATYTATVRTYTITWCNDDGTVLEIDADVPYGETPEYNGQEPQKDGWRFGLWDPEVVPVAGDATYTAVFTQAPVELFIRDHSTGAAVKGATLTLTNAAGTEVWSNTTDTSGITWIPRVDAESSAGGGAEFKPNSTYTLKQTSADSAYICPRGSWTLTVGADGDSFTLARVADAADMSTWPASGPYGARFYLDNVAASTITFKYNYPQGISDQPDDKTDTLPDLAYDYRYTVNEADPAEPIAAGYEFVGWQVDEKSQYVKKGATITLDTLSQPKHTMVAQWRSPLNVSAYTYEGGASSDATLVAGSAGAYQIGTERSLTYSSLEAFSDAYGQQNTAVQTLNNNVAYGLAFTTVKQASGAAVRVTALQYDAAKHAWQYQTAASDNWASIGQGDSLRLYYTSNLVNVKWVLQGDDGTFSTLDEGAFPAKTAAVGYGEWTPYDSLLAPSERPVVQGLAYYRYLGLGAEDAASASALAYADLQSFYIKSTDSGFLYSADATGEGAAFGNTVYVVYSKTPPEGTAFLNIQNYTDWPYLVNGLEVGGADLLAQGKVVLIGADALQVMAAGETSATITARGEAQLAILDGGTRDFVVQGGLQESAAAGTKVSVGIANSERIARTTLEKTAGGTQLSNTSGVTKGTLVASPAAVTVSLDSDLFDLTLKKEWAEGSYADVNDYRVDLVLFEDGTPCVTSESTTAGYFVLRKDGWSATVASLPSRCAYTISEQAVRDSSDADITSDFQPTYADFADGTLTVTNTPSKPVCQVGTESFLTIKAAVEYIKEHSLTDATIYMLSDYIMAESGSVEIPADYNISLMTMPGTAAHTVTRGFASAADMFLVNGTLTIENVTLTGRLGKTVMAKDGNGGLVHVGADAAFTAGSSATLTYGRATNGGAVYAEAGAVVNLAGATIQQNQAVAGGAIGVADDTCRINVSGNTVVSGNSCDNENDNNTHTSNIYLDQDSNQVIQIVGSGLGENANVGVYVPNGDSSQTQFNAHGAPAKPFATYADGANANLDKLSNDRLGGGSGGRSSKYGCASTELESEKAVVWGETFSFTVKVQWLDEELNVLGSAPAGASVVLRLNGGYVTPLVDKTVPNTATVDASGNWEYTFKGLSKYDGNGNPYKYTVSETSILPNDYRRIIFTGDKAVSDNPVSDNPITYSADTGDDQVAIVSNYYRYTGLTVEKKVEPADQGLTASFQVYRILKTGTDFATNGSVRYGGVGSVSDLPLGLRGGVADTSDAANVPVDNKFYTAGANVWYVKTGNALVKFNKFYDIKFKEFTCSGSASSATGVAWSVGDVIRYNDAGNCAVYDGGAWRELGTVDVSYIKDFTRQDGYNGVESAGGESASAGIGPIAVGNANPSTGTAAITAEDKKLSSDYYYYAIENSIVETNGQGRSISNSHQIVATYDPKYEYDQLAQKVTITNVRQDYLSVDKMWPEDAASYGDCVFDVYYIDEVEGGAPAYLSNATNFKNLVKGTPSDDYSTLTVGGTTYNRAGEFTLKESDTGSWVHVLDDANPVTAPTSGNAVYFARERSAGGVTINNPDVDGASITVDAVYKYDKDINQITVTNMSDVLCKVVDADGTEHPFRKLNDAYEYGTTRDASAGSQDVFTIYMLRDYNIPASDVLQIASGKKITLTTASTDAETYTYTYTPPASDRSKTRATITRQTGNAYPFVTMIGTAGAVENTSFTLENIALDGANTAVRFKNSALTGNNNDIYNGGLVYALNATVMLQKGGEGGAQVGVEVTNARASNGGAIYAVASNVSVSDAEFQNCVSTETNSSADRGGGAIWTSGVSTTVKDSVFEGCTANRSGGAVAAMYQSVDGSGGEATTVENCTFTACVATNANGGGVYSRNYKLSVKGCTFRSDEDDNPCKAGQRGGGIHHDNYVTDSATTVDNCSFTGCVTTVPGTGNGAAGDPKYGGAGLNSFADTLTLTNSTFDSCISRVRGGGVLHFHLEPQKSDIRDCTFTNCTSETSGGGGMCLSAMLQLVDNCTFTNCKAASSAGGGIDIACFDQEKDAYVTNCTFTACEAYNNNGGGISFGGRSLTVKDSSFTDCKADSNRAAYGGAIALSIEKCTMESFIAQGCTFTNCTSLSAGGAIYQSADYRYATTPSDIISGCSFTGCRTTSGSGGALHTNAETLVLGAQDAPVSFVDCTADKGWGGAVNHSRGTETASTTIEYCAFENCEATRTDNNDARGGAVYLTTNALSVQNSTFTDVRAKGSGGAIYHDRNYPTAQATFESVSFNGVTALNGEGGALWTYVPTMKFTDVGFENCVARNSGGAVYQNISTGSYVPGSDVSLVRCTFADCQSVTQFAGALRINAEKLSILGEPGVDTFTNCTAYSGGGAVLHWQNNSADIATEIKGCSFKNCVSTNQRGGAVYTLATTLSMDGLTFEDCNSRNEGGAVYHEMNGTYLDSSWAKVTDSTFDRCQARVSSAGALYSNARELEVVGQSRVTSFTDCAAGNGHGGSVYHNRDNAKAKTTISQCSFTNSTATRSDTNNDARGGALCTWAPVMDVQDASFENCTSRGTGGAVYQSVGGGNVSVSSATVERATFAHCKAEKASAGALYSNALTLSVTGQAGMATSETETATFDDCTAGSGHGGAVYHDRSVLGSTTTIEQCAFRDCTATRSDNSTDSRGGALCTWAAAVNLEDDSFRNCAAKGSGGAVRHETSNDGSIWPTTSFTAVKCAFVDCTAQNSTGGAVYSNALLFKADGGDAVTTFANCTSRSDGGAIYQNRSNEGSRVQLSACEFTECMAYSAGNNDVGGGAIRIEARAFGIAGSSFAACATTRSGGAIYSMRAEVTMTDSTVSNCTATVHGGGLYQRSDDSRAVFLYGSTFAGNKAGTNGGGVCTYSNNALLMDGCTFTENEAGSQGGAVFFYSNNNITLRNGTSVTRNRLGNATVENAAGIYIHQDRSQATLVLGGAEGVDSDTITVYDNFTSADAQSNVRLIRSGTWNSKFQRYNDRANSVLLLSNLEKPGVGIVGTIGVVNPGPENTQFGVGDVAGRTGMEYIVSDIDTQYGKLDPSDHDQLKIIWYAPPVCKITDQYGFSLYYDFGEDQKTAAFSSLKDAIEVLNDATAGYLHDGDGKTPSPLQIQMLVPDYTIKEAMPALTRTITLTTANPGLGEYDYPINATSPTATITRGASVLAGSMFTVSPGISLTVKSITLDGGNREGAPLTVSTNGGIIYGQSNATIMLTEGAVLRNSAVSGVNNGGAVYVTGGTNPDIPALVMERNATISNCSAGNGGGVYLTGGVLFNMNDAPHIEECSASTAGGAVYVSPYATMAFADNPNPVIRGNAITDATGAGAGIYLPDNNSKLYLRLGSSAVIADNYVLGTDDASRQNGFEDYPLLRQDIYLGESGEPATSIVLTGDVSVAEGSIWVWAESDVHYKTEMQFATVATDADGNPAFTPRDSSLAAFRNARDDAETENDTDSYLYGLTEDGVNVIWSYNTGSAKVILRKVADAGGTYESLAGATFTVYKGRSARPYVVRHEDGTRETLSGLVSGEAGVFWIGTLPYGTYYLNETAAPAGYSAGKWFKLTIDENGVVMTRAADSRSAL